MQDFGDFGKAVDALLVLHSLALTLRQLRKGRFWTQVVEQIRGLSGDSLWFLRCFYPFLHQEMVTIDAFARFLLLCNKEAEQFRHSHTYSTVEASPVNASKS